MYDVSLKRRWDEYNIRENAREKGYKDGMEKGKEESKKEFVRNLILKTDFSDEEIMEMASVSLELVKEIRLEVDGE